MMLRCLGALEEVFWLMDQQSPGHFCTVMEVQGATTPSQWRASLDQLQKRHPLWAACIQVDEDGIPCFYSEMECQIPLRLLVLSSTPDWSKLVLEELSRRFITTQAPLLRTTLLWNEERAIFILTAHHVIADGLSLTFAVRDILHGLGGRTLARTCLPLPQDSIVSELMGQTEACETRRHPNSRITGPLWGGGTRGQPHFYALQYSRQFTRELIRSSRQMGITVGGLLTASCSIALRELCPVLTDGPVSIVSPVSRRALLGVGEDSGLYLGWTRVLCERSKQQDIWDIARHASGTLAQASTLEATLASNQRICRAVYSGLAEEILSPEGLQRDIYLSNQGSIPFSPQIGTLRLVGLWSAATPGFSQEHRLSVTTVDDGLCLTHATYSPHTDFPARLKGVLERAVGMVKV
jgi:Condensation domain